MTETSISKPSGPTRSRARNALITWSLGNIYTLTTLCVGFIATPLLLKYLGTERVGAYRVMGDWFGYLALTDLGIGGALTVLIVRAKNSTEPSRVAAVTRYAMGVLSALLFISLPLGIILVYYLPNLVKTQPSLDSELRLAFVISLLGLLLTPLSVFRLVLEAAQRGYQVHGALLLQSLTITGLSLLLAWGKWGLPGQAIATLAGLSVYYTMTLRWSLPDIPMLVSTAPAWVPKRQILGLSWPQAVVAGGHRLNLMTDSIVVSMFLGPAQVAVLFITQRTISTIGGQVNAMVNASGVALNELHAIGNANIFQLRLADLTRMVVGLGLVLTGTAAAYNAQFVRLWVGHALYGGDLLSALTLFSVVIYGLVCVFTFVIDLQGDTRHRLKAGVAGSTLNLALSIVLVRRMGLAGVTLGTICGYLLADAWYCPRLMCLRYDVDGWLLARAVGRGAGVGLPWVAAVWAFSHTHVPRYGWAGFITELVPVGLLALGYCWLAILTSSERDVLQARISNFFQFGSKPLGGIDL